MGSLGEKDVRRCGTGKDPILPSVLASLKAWRFRRISKYSMRLCADNNLGGSR